MTPPASPPTTLPRRSRLSSHVIAIGGALVWFPAAIAVAQTAVVQQGWNPQQILHTETYVKPPAVIERVLASSVPAVRAARLDPRTALQVG